MENGKIDEGSFNDQTLINASAGADSGGALVKWCVDFDTQGILAKKEHKIWKEYRKMEREKRRMLKMIKKEKEREEAEEGLETREDSLGQCGIDDESIITHNSMAAASEKKRSRKKKKGENKGKDKDKDRGGRDEGSQENTRGSSAKGSVKKHHNILKEDTEQVKFDAVTTIFKYTVTAVHSKLYSRNSPVLHGFKLERWTSQGSSIAAAFASHDPDEIRILRGVIRELITSCAKEKKHHRQHKNKGGQGLWGSAGGSENETNGMTQTDASAESISILRERSAADIVSGTAITSPFSVADFSPSRHITSRKDHPSGGIGAGPHIHFHGASLTKSEVSATNTSSLIDRALHSECGYSDSDDGGARMRSHWGRHHHRLGKLGVKRNLGSQISGHSVI